MWGLQTSARRARRFVLQKRGSSWHQIWCFQLYASFRHIRSICKSCSDIRAKEISFWPFCMEIFRKAAHICRQFALCRHSKLGMDNRRVMPSCVVLQIRHTYWFAHSRRLFIFWIFNYLSADTSTLDNPEKIGLVTGYFIERYSLCNLHFQVSPITNPSWKAYFKAAYIKL